MIISSTRLLAHCCCIYMLLLSVAPITTASPTRKTTTTKSSPQVSREDKKASSDLPSRKGKCQYNLTDSSHPLYADSSRYQHLGYTQCEFIIQAPSSQLILLNFTDIHSLPDMPVEIGVRRQHHQQAATVTTTTTSLFPPPPTTTASIETPLRETSTGKENSGHQASSTNSHRPSQGKEDSVSSVSGKDLSSNPSPPTSLSNHTKCIRNSSLDHRNSGSSTNSDSDKASEEKNNSIYKPSSSQTEDSSSSEESLKTSRSFKKDILQKTKDSTNPEPSTSPFSNLPPYLDIGEGVSKTDHHCNLKLIIEGVDDSGEDNPQVICWQQSWQSRIPLVYRYSVPIKITYFWEEHCGSAFALDFRFLQSGGIDCPFRCNSHLCLLQDQICDGFPDCPDQSDEHSSACTLARPQQEDGNPHVISVIVIVISVIVAIIIVAVVILMISRTRCRNGARQGRDSLLQPPPSSEVCRSTSGSMQDNGQYEALLHDRQHQHPQPQLAALTVMVPSNLKDSQLLRQHQQQQHQMDQQHHQIQRHKVNQNHSATPETTAMLPQEDLRHVNPWQQHQHHQQRHHKHTPKQTSPDELFPPHIPVSADGEEGYAIAQKSLHSKQQLERNWQVEQEVFRPPPNRTICDRDSPPPPYSLNPPGAKSLDSLVPPVGVVSVLRPARTSLTPHGSPTGVPRCHSLSCHH